jgi:chromosomal replication initiator protein
VAAGKKPPPTTCPIQPELALAAAVSKRVGQARYGLWFEGHARFVPLGREVTVVVRNDQTRDWLEHTFGIAVREAVVDICGSGTAVRWAVDSSLISEHHAERMEPQRPSPSLAPCGSPASRDRHDLFGDPIRERKSKSRSPSTDPSYAGSRAGRRWRLLADFVVGACNRVAHAAATSVVEEPGAGANPLVIHGPVGTGKTHILEGVFAGLRRQLEGRPCFVTAEEFTTRFVAASQHGKMGAFRRQFRDCGALLLDDLHFLASRKATQAEFLHTFDALIADGRQVVVTTDCHPRLADELMPELVDRLLGGAIWGLMPPEHETRLDILRRKAAGANPPIPDAILKLLASRLRGNVRELEGAIHSVRHYSRVTGRPVDPAALQEVLGELLRHSVRAATINDVDAAVCAVLRLPAGALQAKSRAWIVTHPRMLAMYLCRKHTAATYGEISTHFGAKTHSTAVAAEKKVSVWMEKDLTVAIGDRDWRATEIRDRIERELQR